MSQLLDQLRTALRARHYSRRTEQAYCLWVERYVRFHGVRHPAEMGEPEINAFVTHLAVQERVSASTQTQALSALLFLYRHVLGRKVGELGDLVRASKPRRLPVVLTRSEVKALLAELGGDRWLMASLMYGSGLRLMECLRLRVLDLEPQRAEILVRDGKGGKDRVTMLALSEARPHGTAHTRPSTSPARPRRGLGPSAAPRRLGPQVPRRADRVALAVGLPPAAARELLELSWIQLSRGEVFRAAA